jgi:hypothetical protein
MKELIADLSMEITFREVKLVIFQLFCSLMASVVIFYLYRRKKNVEISLAEVCMVASVTTFLTIVSRYYLPLSIISLAALLVFALGLKRRTEESGLPYLLLGVLTVSIGIGSGYVVLTGIYYLLGILPLFLLKAKE